MIPENVVPKVGFWQTRKPFPRHDFSALEQSELVKTQGIVAATQRQLEEQLKSRLRLEPNVEEIRYFYYEVKNDTSADKVSSTE